MKWFKLGGFAVSSFLLTAAAGYFLENPHGGLNFACFFWCFMLAIGTFFATAKTLFDVIR